MQVRPTSALMLTAIPGSQKSTRASRVSNAKLRSSINRGTSRRQSGGRRDSAIKRFSMLLRSHNAHMKIRHSLAAPWIRTPILFLLVSMNVISAVYLGLWGVFFFTAHPIIVSTLNLYAPKPSGIIYIGLALWHSHDIGIILFGTHKIHQVREQPRFLASFHLKWIQNIKIKWIRRFASWIAKNEIDRLLRHALVIVVLSIHAQHVSHHVVLDWFAFTYTTLVAFYCFITPSCLLSPHPFIKRYVTLLNDAFFHFLLSTGVSALVFFPQVAKFSSTNTLPWLQEYLQHLVLTDRALISSSLSDLLLFLFIFATNHLTLHHLTDVALSATAIQQMESTMSQKPEKTREKSEMQDTFPITQPHVENQTPVHFMARMTMFKAGISARRLTERAFLGFREQRQIQFKLFFFANVIWGFLLVVAACTGLWHADCPPGCLTHTSPWFDPNSCTCRHFQLHCPKLDISSDSEAEKLLESLDKSLFSLHIVECSFKNGLNATILNRFDGLFSLRFDFTHLTTWNDGTLPKTLQVLELRYCNLTEVPGILIKETMPSLVSLTIDSSKISMIPQVLATWPLLHHVRITNSRLNSFPPALTNSSTVSIVNLDMNYITSLAPQEIPPNIAYLDLSHNKISNLSKSFLDIYDKSPFDLLLSSNPLDVLDPYFLAMILLSPESLGIANTPVCQAIAHSLPTSIRDAICYETCAPQCTKQSLGDGVPDVQCYVASCQYDNGDFEQYN